MEIYRDLLEHMYLNAAARRADPRTGTQEKYLEHLADSIADDRRFATVATTGGELQRQVVAFLEQKLSPRERKKKIERIRAAQKKGAASGS